MDKPYGIEFGPQEMTTVKGQPMTVQSGQPTEDFWNAWKGSKANVRAQGLSVRKDEKTGQFVVKWWKPVGAPAQAQGQVYPGDVQRSMDEYGHPNASSTFVEPAPQVPAHLVPEDRHDPLGRPGQSPITHPPAQNEPAYRVMSAQARFTHKLRCLVVDAEEHVSNHDIAEVLSVFVNEYMAKR